MSQLDLEAIKARAEKATPGPWGGPWDAGDELLIETKDHASFICALSTDDEEERTKNGHGNATFIIHARDDVPALVAEVERLRGLDAEAKAPGPMDCTPREAEWATLTFQRLSRLCDETGAPLLDLFSRRPPGDGRAVVIKALVQALREDATERTS